MIRKLLIAAALTSGVYAAFAQSAITQYAFSHIDSCSYNPNTPGIYTYISGAVSNPATGMNITTYWGDGSSSNQDVNIAGNIYDSHNYALPGNYTISTVLMDASSNPLDTITETVSVICTTIWGKSYLDNNTNCTFDNDGTDNYLSINQQIQVLENGNPIDTFVISFGGYMYTLDNPNPSATYTLHPINIPAGYNLTCPTADYSFSLSGINTQPFFDFGYQCDGSFTGFDLSTYMSGLLRVVNNSYLQINATNNACTPHDGTVTLNISPKYTFAEANITPSSTSGNTLTWNVNNLSGSFPQYIYVKLTPATTLTEGDTATNTVTITPTAGDVDATNNVYTYTDTIRASYDPNDKKVSPSGYIDAGQELTYTVDFENLGNDTAFNIHVIDTLSSNLDYSTFQLVSSSHRVTVNHFETSDGVHTVRFDFKDINLASAEHPESNKGFIVYRVKAKEGLEDGTEIKNTAHIFFDINPDVVTNTTVNTLGEKPTSLSQISKEDGITVYPNPASNTLFIDNKLGNFNQASIINAVGQNMMTFDISKQTNSLNISRLGKGIYYLMISGNKGNRMVKFVVK